MRSVVLVALATPLTAWAVPSYSGDAPGTRITTSDPNYDIATESLVVGGTVHGVSAGALSTNFRVFFNGIDGSISGTPTQAVVSATIPIGPEFGGNPGPWPSWLPFGDMMTEETLVPKPLFFEVMSKATRQVVFRDRTTLYDLRQDGLVQNAFAVVDVEDGMVAQLTPMGLDALIPVHEADLPFPDAAALDTELHARLTTLPVLVSVPTDVCRNLETLAASEPGWLLLPEYVEAQASAAAAYLLFADGTVTSCVQTPPLPFDFEVCVNLIEAEALDLNVAGQSVAALEFGVPTRTLQSTVDLDGPSAVFELRLRDLEVRYRHGAPGCLPTIDPVHLDNGIDVGQNTIDSTAWLDDWARCPGSMADAVAVASGPLLHDLSVGLDPETIDVSAGDHAAFDLPSPSWTASGTCVESWLNPSAAALLPGFEVPLEAALGSAVDDAWPRTAEASALDALLQPWEIGTRPLPGAVLTADLTELATDPLPGMVTRWRTSSEPTDPLRASRMLAPWLFKAPRAYGFDVSDDALDPDGHPFDSSFSVSTTHLNAQLRTRNATHGAWLDLRPSYADLGLPSSGGNPSNAPAPLTGANLGQWFSPFSSYGATTFTITVTPTLPPQVFMDPDTSFPAGETPLAFAYPALRVDFATVGIPSSVVATVWIDLWDTDLVLDLDGSGVVRAAVDTPSWSSVATMTPQGCPMAPLLDVPAFQNSCDDDFAAHVLALVQPSILASTAAVLDEIAALDGVDTPTGGTTSRRLDPMLQYQHGMYVRWFGQLVP